MVVDTSDQKIGSVVSPTKAPIHTARPLTRSVAAQFDRNTLSAHQTWGGLVSAFTALQSHKRPRNGQKMAVVFIPLFSGCVLAVYKWSSMWDCRRSVTCSVRQYFGGSSSRFWRGKSPPQTHPGFPCWGGKFGIALLKQYMTDTVNFRLFPRFGVIGSDINSWAW